MDGKKIAFARARERTEGDSESTICTDPFGQRVLNLRAQALRFREDLNALKSPRTREATQSRFFSPFQAVRNDILFSVLYVFDGLLTALTH